MRYCVAKVVWMYYQYKLLPVVPPTVVNLLYVLPLGETCLMFTLVHFDLMSSLCLRKVGQFFAGAVCVTPQAIHMMAIVLQILR